MKKKIISSLFAAAILAAATLSWGSSVHVENYSENLQMSDLGVNITNSSIVSSTTSDTATVNGTPYTDATASPAFTSSQLGTISSNNAMVSSSTTVALSSVPINAGPSADVYALAAGSVAVEPFATLPNQARLQTIATFQQNITTSAIGTLIIGMDFRNFWGGDASSFTGTWRNTFTFLDAANQPVPYVVTTYTGAGGIYNPATGTFTVDGTYLGVNNGDNNLTSSLFITANNLTAGDYIWTTTASFDAANPVPEPSTFVLAGSGLLGLFFMRRRSKKA